MSRWQWMAALIAVSSACGDAQSFEAGMKIICSAPEQDDARHAAPAEQMEAISRWVDQRLTNKRARALFARLGELPPDQRAKTLTDAAREAGVAPCALAVMVAPPPPADDGSATPPPDEPPNVADHGSPPPAPGDEVDGTGLQVEPEPPQPARSRLTLGEITTLDPSSLDSAAISKTIRQKYTVLLRRCYERSLAERPELRGSIAAQVTVGTTGRVTEVTMTPFDDAVDTCAKSLIVNWRFEVPRDAAGQPTTQRFTFAATVEPAS